MCGDVSCARWDLQFGHQTQESDQEIPLLLEHVRPGEGYKPNFPMFSKLNVNGTGEDELFTFLKAALPYPSGSLIHQPGFARHMRFGTQYWVIPHFSAVGRWIPFWFLPFPLLARAGGVY